jgi:soluble lytic murein transglycosylase
MAKSKVGARGLMQIMPTTARGVAKRRGDTYRGASSLYDPQLNIVLGSAYYAELLRRYDGNRIKALAAYNAGPSRVDRWASGSLAPDQWVDSLPFAETREYVQAVLTYTVIYRVLSGEPAHLMTQSEAEATY